jgi:hypothetical protein
VEQGIRVGVFHPVNPLLATHMQQMTHIPPAYTSRLIGTPDEMLEETLDLFLRGVQAYILYELAGIIYSSLAGAPQTA